MVNSKKITTVTSGLLMSLLANQVFAAGFQLQEQNVTSLGTAYSGTAALAEDASTGFYNAAGLTRITEGQIVLGAVGIQNDIDFNASASNVSTMPNTPVPGATDDDPGQTTAVPVFHLAKRLDDKWVFGFGLTSPFNLFTKYDQNGIARYLATRSQVQTYNFSPSLAYQVLPSLSLGAGADAQYLKARFYSQFGDGNVATDGFQKNRTEGWGYGWHVGALWSPRENTRVGLNYRSEMSVRTEGKSENLMTMGDFQVGTSVPDKADQSGQYFLEKVNARIVLPDTATLSVYHAVNPKVALTADVAWTNWSRFHTLNLNFNPAFVATMGSVPINAGLDVEVLENFKDTWRYALGLTYTHDDRWLFRVGGAFEETPTRDEFRTARIPDEDRYWLAIGGAYTFNKKWQLDFGYAHLFFKDASLDENAPFQAGTQTPSSLAALSGEYESSANVIGLQVRYNFI